MCGDALAGRTGDVAVREHGESAGGVTCELVERPALRPAFGGYVVWCGVGDMVLCGGGDMMCYVVLVI